MTPPRPPLLVDLGAQPQTLAWLVATLKVRRVRPVRVAPFELVDLAELEKFYSDDWPAIGVCAPSYRVLRQALWALPSLGRGLRIVIGVEEAPNLVRRLGPRRHAYPRLARGLSTDVAGEDGPDTQLDFGFAKPVSLHRAVVDHVAVGPQAYAAVPLGGVRVGVSDVRAARWVAGDPSARTPANVDRTWASDNPNLTSIDVVFGGSDGRAPDQLDVTTRCPPVDVQLVNPHGFRTDVSGPVGLMSVTADQRRVQVVRDDAPVVTFEVRHGLTTTDVARLRQLPYVDAAGLAALPAPEHAGVLAQLAAAAVPVVAGPLSEQTRSLLDADLVACLDSATEQALGSAAGRELWALRARRAALAAHSVAGSRQRLLPQGGGLDPAPAVSALLVTRRPQLLAGALAGLGAQTHRNLQVVIVVHGAAAPADLGEQLRDFEHSVVLTEPASTVFGTVLNRATAAASGEFVTKIDDDDWYGPHHVTDLLAALEWSGAHLVGCLDEYVYLAQRDLTVRRHDYTRYESVAHRVAGPTMLLRREDLRAFGGWRAAPSGVDLALIHNVRDAGGLIYRTHGLGFMLCRHGRGHTWTLDEERFVESAHQQWPGFHPPPELGDVDAARARLHALRLLDR